MYLKTTYKSLAIIILFTFSIVGCTSVQSETTTPSTPTISETTPTLPTNSIIPTTIVQQATPAFDLSDYAFPDSIDSTKQYLFYLHGRIIEDQGLLAKSPEYGTYQYEEILEALANHGFVVISEQRPKNADGWEYARRSAKQIAKLLSANVPPGSITVVGASKGASIATAISNLVGNSEVNYVLLGSCHPSLIEEWRLQGLTLSGNVLAIYDIADDEYSGSCEDLFTRSEGKGLSRYSELVLHVGTGHGILYEPLEEWVVPTVRWANQEW